MKELSVCQISPLVIQSSWLSVRVVTGKVKSMYFRSRLMWAGVLFFPLFSSVILDRFLHVGYCDSSTSLSKKCCKKYIIICEVVILYLTKTVAPLREVTPYISWAPSRFSYITPLDLYSKAIRKRQFLWDVCFGSEDSCLIFLYSSVF